MARKTKPPHISQKDWDAVDVPELADDEMAKARPAAEAVPQVVDAYRRSRGPQKAPTKQQVTLRLDQEVVAHFKESGPGWQTRINETLVTAVRESMEPREKKRG